MEFTQSELLRSKLEDIKNNPYSIVLVDEIEKKGLHDNLAANKENAFLSRELVTLQSARGFSGTLEQLEFKGLASDALADIFRTNELRQLDSLEIGKIIRKGSKSFWLGAF